MKEVLLTEVCDIQYGFAFDSNLFSESEGVPLVRIRDVVRGYSETYTKEPFSAEYEVRDGDILIGMDGEFNIAKWNGGKAALNQRVCKLIPKAVDSGFIFYFMLLALKKIEEKTPFVTVKHLSAKELNKISVPLPSMERQRIIAETLDKVNRLISLRKKQLQKLDDLVKSRFVEMFGSTRNNEKGWKMRCFEEITDVITDGEHATPKRVKQGLYLLSARNILDHTLQLNDVDYIDHEEYERIARRITPQAGDVLISCSGSVGRCCCIPEGLKLQMVRSVALLRFKKEVNPLFAEHMITSDGLQEQINASKTASSQANLFQGKIAKLKGFIPPLALQNEFVTFVKQVDTTRLTLQNGLNKMELLKQSLMQKYFE